MKGFIVKACRWSLAAMGITSVTACEEGIIKTTCEYGTPYCEFEVKCKVVDSRTNVPINGVKMTPGAEYVETDGNGNSQNVFIPHANAQEVVNGTIEIKGIISAGSNEKLHIKLEDINPDSNGHYKDSIYVVPMQKMNSEKKEDKWYLGKYGAEATIKAEELKK